MFILIPISHVDFSTISNNWNLIAKMNKLYIIQACIIVIKSKDYAMTAIYPFININNDSKPHDKHVHTRHVLELLKCYVLMAT